MVLQFLSYKGPCQHGTFFLAEKLKHHRLKPGGVREGSNVLLAEKLKYHRLKPGGVLLVTVCVREKGSIRYYAKPNHDKLTGVDYDGSKEITLKVIPNATGINER